MIKHCDRDNRFILAYVLYADNSNKLYTDSAKTKGCVSSELEKEFLSGKLVIATDTGYVKPTFFVAVSGTTVASVKAPSVTGSTASVLTFSATTTD